MAPEDWGEEGTWDTEPVAMAGSGCKGAWREDFLGEDMAAGAEPLAFIPKAAVGSPFQACSWGREDCPSLSRPDTPTPKRGSRWVRGGLPKWRKWGSHWLRAGATMQTGQDGRPWDGQCQDTW